MSFGPYGNGGTSGRGISHLQFQQQKNRERAQEYLENDLRSYHKQVNLINAANRSQKTVANKRRTRRLQQQNQELLRGYEIEQSMRARELARVKAEQDQKLAAAMKAMKVKEQSKQAQARVVCEQSEELKELKAKIAAAKLNKVWTFLFLFVQMCWRFENVVLQYVGGCG